MRSGNPELNDLLVGFDSSAVDLDDRGFAGTAGIGSAEANKIMTADKHRYGFRHPLDVQLVLDPPYMSFYECLLPPGNLIQVDALARVMARVKTRAGALDIENRDIGGKQIIEAALDDIRSSLSGRRTHLDVHDLSKRVHTRIGSSRTLDIDFAVKYLQCSSSDLAHDGAGILLNLPSAVASTVIFKGDFESRHDLRAPIRAIKPFPASAEA